VLSNTIMPQVTCKVRNSLASHGAHSTTLLGLHIVRSVPSTQSIDWTTS
jgi:hypothetical protein